MVTEVSKVLIIRFSSFGDVTQCLSVPSRLKDLGENVEIHWVTRADFAPLLEGHPAITKLWTLDRKTGIKGLLRLVAQLRHVGFTHIYDAHNNLRSHFIGWALGPPWDLTRIFNPPELLRKSQKRFLRFLLFRFHINRFEKPFSGQRDLLEPLTKWGLSKKLPPAPQLWLKEADLHQARLKLGDFQNKKFIAIAASAAYPLKRWPLEHWKKLVMLEPQRSFVLLGGPEDLFLQEIHQMAPERILNLAGRTSLTESAAVLSLSQLVVANDTGLLHVAEQLGMPAIALMGPAPFGFPSRDSTKIMELDLSCRPCSKHGQGPCKNSQFQKCLQDISPELVKNELQRKAPLV